MNNRKFVTRKDPVVDRARQGNQELRMRLNELSQLARIETLKRQKAADENNAVRSISQSVKGNFTGGGLQSNQSSTTSPQPSMNQKQFELQPQLSQSVAKLENQLRADPQSLLVHPLDQSTSNLNSQQQLNRIEETSMRQLDSISKLQNRLLKTNSMMYASAGGGGKVFASNDYLCDDVKGTNSALQPGYMTGMPKKITINPKRSQQQMLLNHSNAAALHSSKLRHQQRQSSMDRSVMMKQGERMIDTSTDASTRDPTNRNSLPAPGGRFNSNSSYRTPLKPLQPQGKVISKTPSQIKQITGMKPSQTALYSSMTQIQQEKKRLSKPVHGNQDLYLDESLLATSPRVPASVAKRAFKMREEEKAGKKITSKLKDAKNKKQMARRQSPEPEDGYKIKWGDESPDMAEQVIEHARFSDPATHYFEPVSPASPSTLKSLQMHSQLNSEQRQMIDQIIDKLDLQEAIRQKARIFFNRQEEKLKFSESNLDKVKNIAYGNIALTLVDDRAKQVMQNVKQNSFNEAIQLPGSKPKYAINSTSDASQILTGVARNKAKIDEDQEILDNMYNERQVSSQKEIQWKLKHMMEDQSQDYSSQPDMVLESKMLQTDPDLCQDTLELTDGQMFEKLDKEGEAAITLNSSMYGSSIIPEEKHEVSKQIKGLQSGSQSPDEETNQQPKFGLLRKQNFKIELPDITGGSGLRNGDDSGSESGSRALDLLKISNQYKSAQKAKLARTMYNHRPVEPRQKLDSFKKDYSPLVLGQYRFGLNQKRPDPKAPPALRYSQMASYRFAESNSRYMELYDEQLAEFRKTRRFLSKQISETPDGRVQAQKVLAASPEHAEMTRRLQLHLIDEKINEDEETSRGLKEIQKYNLKTKAMERRRLEHDSNCSSQTSNSQKKLIKQAKDQSYAKLLRSASAGTLQSETVEQLGRSRTVLGLADGLAHHSIGGVDDGLDIHEDFISDADEEEQAKMHKFTYEMEQIVQDEYFKGQEGKMGLALFCREQLEEQKRYFRLQQKQLLNYLDILFNGNKLQPEYINMAKNLTSKLKRQKTDCSLARQEANEIHESHMQNLEIDQQNINTEIISMLADDIMKKTDFFAMFKDKDRGKKEIFEDISSPVTTPQQQTESDFKKFHRSDLLRGDAIQVGALFPRDPHPTPGRSGPGLARQANLGRQEPSSRRLPSRSDSSLSSVSSTDSRTKDQERAIQSFIDQCEKSMVVTLPLLLRMTCKKMILEGYQLNHGLCQALSIAFSHFKDIASDFHLDSNSLTDDDFAVLLEGMGTLREVSRLTYCNNAFGQKSLSALLPLLASDPRTGLRSLHLKHCKMAAAVTTRLLQSINHQQNYIKSLSLVNVNLCSLNSQALCEFIRGARTLHELDISWNGMRCHQMYELLAVIVDNRTLHDLNISYNNFQDQLQEKYAESTPEQAILHQAQMQKLEAKRKKAKSDAQKAAVELEAANNSMQQVRMLIQFIKMNSNLMHLDLSGMQMTQAMMNEFGRGLRRTKSLVSLHLSQNCGDTQELRDAIAERAHLAPVEEVFHPEIRKFDIHKAIEAAANNGNIGNNKAKKKSFKLEKSVKFTETRRPMTPTLEQQLFKEKPIKKLNINEQLTLKNILTGKRGSVNRAKEEKDSLEMLVFTRQLGHKAEIPGSGQWRMISSAHDSQERCWVCNLEMYTLIFWSREFGLQTQSELTKQGLDEMELEEYFYEIEQRNSKLGITVDYKKDAGNPQLFEDAHKVLGYPQIYGEFNNWKPQRMYTIEELCYLVDKDRPNIISDLKKAKHINPMVEKVADMNDREKRRYYDKVKSLFTKYSKIKNWRKNLGSNLRYKKPFLANSEALLLQQGNANLNLAKMNEQLLPSDSESDFASGSESDRSMSEASPRNFLKKEVTPTMRGMKKGGLQPLKGKQNKPKIPRNQLHTAKDRERMKRQLYVVPCFLKPGKQTLVVQSQMYQDDLISADESEAQSYANWQPLALGARKSSQITRNEGIKRSAVLNQSVEDVEVSDRFFIHQVVAPARRERVPHFAKKLVRKQTDDNKFNRELTVFKEWKPPSDKDLQAMFVHDRELWKLPRFIKEEWQLKEVYELFRTNLRKLFHIFITVAASSNFPGISWLDFTRFADTCKVVDKAINQSDIDRFFLASAGDNQNSGCLRYQFFEALMRVADAKYLKSGRASSYAEALSMFLNNNVFPLGYTTEWQEFRDDIWWNYETHSIMDANLNHLNKLYKSMWAPRKKYMTKGDCVELMVKATGIMHDDNKVAYCYGMSKMFVIKETQQRQVYEEMKFIEFQEFLGRCAHMKYDDEEPMGEKLKMLLDELLPVYGMTRVEVEEEEVVLSESDPDY